MAFKRICKEPFCNSVTDKGAYCEAHRLKAERPFRQPETSKRRLYNHTWDKNRRAFLERQPWCVSCLARGSYVLANEVDHIIPHKGNSELFNDSNNWQALCKRCHSRKTAKEREGYNVRESLTIKDN